MKALADRRVEATVIGCTIEVTTTTTNAIGVTLKTEEHEE